MHLYALSLDCYLCFLYLSCYLAITICLHILYFAINRELPSLCCIIKFVNKLFSNLSGLAGCSPLLQTTDRTPLLDQYDWN